MGEVEAADRIAADRTAAEPRPITLLLVDDQRIVGAAVGRLLASEPDIQLHWCDNAADAVPRANQIKPTIILQDLFMPDIDGLTLVEMFRGNPTTATTPVIVLSAEDDSNTRMRAFAAGASDYLLKLPAKQDFIACIRRHAATPSRAEGCTR
jgi:PleD family two-component response regulator